MPFSSAIALSRRGIYGFYAIAYSLKRKSCEYNFLIHERHKKYYSVEGYYLGNLYWVPNKGKIMNTYGLRSINSQTFNLQYDTSYVYPKQARNALVTFLRVHNLSLNILGYIPGISIVSGCVRIGTGLAMCAVALAVGERNAKQGLIIGHWYDECLITGITQIARGVLEAFVPFGWIANASLDTIATFWNIKQECQNNPTFRTSVGEYQGHQPYRDPEYPLPFLFLSAV
jgi:hypothetical protein